MTMIHRIEGCGEMKENVLVTWTQEAHHFWPQNKKSPTIYNLPNRGRQKQAGSQSGTMSIRRHLHCAVGEGNREEKDSGSRSPKDSWSAMVIVVSGGLRSMLKNVFPKCDV